MIGSASVISRDVVNVFMVCIGLVSPHMLCAFDYFSCYFFEGGGVVFASCLWLLFHLWQNFHHCVYMLVLWLLVLCYGGLVGALKFF